MSTGDAPRPGKHVPVLDGIRGLAILLVMFQHFFFHAEPGPHISDSVLFAAASRSWMGVDLFFVLSGYLITGILHDAKGRPHYFRNFYARRTLRIFPLYYFVLFLFYVVLARVDVPGIQSYLADSAPDQAWHWTYLSNFRIAWRGAWYHHHVPNVFWSLAIEEQFYLCWPVVVLALRRTALMRVCLGLFVAALALRLGLAMRTDSSWITSFVLTPARCDGLVLGAFLALLARGPRGLAPYRRHAAFALGAALVPVLWLEMQRGPDWREQPLQSLRFSGVAVTFAALLLLTVTAGAGSLLERVFAGKGLAFLGKYSYALYLWHGPADTWMRSIYDPAEAALVGGSRLPAQILFCALAGGTAVAASLLSWHLLEKHCLALKKRFAVRPPGVQA